MVPVDEATAARARAYHYWLQQQNRDEALKIHPFDPFDFSWTLQLEGQPYPPSTIELEHAEFIYNSVFTALFDAKNKSNQRSV